MNKADHIKHYRNAITGTALAFAVIMTSHSGPNLPETTSSPTDAKNQYVAYTSKQQRFNDYLFEGKESKTAIA